MEFEDLITGTKWLLLKELSKKECSLSELAKKTDTSTANVAQLLRLLVAYKLVTKRKLKTNQRGKPKTLYGLDQGYGMLVTIGDGVAVKKSFMLNPRLKTMSDIFMADAALKKSVHDIVLFSIAALLQYPDFSDEMKEEQVYFLQKLFWTYDHIWVHLKGLALLSYNTKKTEYLAIIDDVTKARKEMSNIKLARYDGKEREMIFWNHTEDEVLQGLAKNEHYYTSKIKQCHIVYEKENVLSKLKVGE